MGLTEGIHRGIPEGTLEEIPKKVLEGIPGGFSEMFEEIQHEMFGGVLK